LGDGKEVDPGRRDEGESNELAREESDVFPSVLLFVLLLFVVVDDGFDNDKDAFEAVLLVVAALVVDREEDEEDEEEDGVRAYKIAGRAEG